MGEYQRFIAYIYEYVDGIKGNNAGFVKVESRNGVCRFQVHLQGVGKEESPLQLQGYAGNHSRVEMMYLGNCQVMDGTVDFRGSTSSRNFGNSAYPLEQMGGMYLEGKGGSTYATAWEDSVIGIGLLKDAVHKSKSASRDQEEMTEPTQSMAEVPEVSKDHLVSENEKQEAEPEILNSVEQEDLEEPADAREEPDALGEAVQAEEASVDSPDKNDPVCSESVHAACGEEPSGESMVPKENSSSYAYSRNQSPGTRNRGGGNISQNMTCLERKWEHFQCQYPPLSPFPDGELSECIRIMPKDVMYLSKDDWRLGRNNFLMQGFRNHQHLIMGKTKDGSFYLGVPGYNENQEKFMANMFGFVIFKSAVVEGQPEKFGYWLRQVR